MRQISDQNALYEMARLIAGQKSSNRHYRDDVISEAYLAVAEGATTKREVENAVRKSLRGEWEDEDRHVSLQISDSVARQELPERARPDLWAAMAKLEPNQRATVILTFWYGLDQTEVADIFGCTQKTISKTLDRAVDALRKILANGYKTPRDFAVGE
jgi:RNA polymerase sigma factor (sigma-70 family)